MNESTKQQQREAAQLIGQVKHLLNHQFLLVACRGSLLKDMGPALMSDFSIAVAKGDAHGAQLPSVDALACHDALCELIKQGHSLGRALDLARSSPVTASAFEREQQRDLERMLVERGGAL
jgi:hypothetical protein